MADGEVIIGTKLDTDGIKEGAQKLKQEVQQAANEAANSARKIEKALKDIDVSEAADGLGEAFDKECAKAEDSLRETADTAEDAATEITQAFEDVGESIAEAAEEGADAQKDAMKETVDETEKVREAMREAFEEGWKKATQESESGASKVKRALDDIGDKAKQVGQEIKDALSGEGLGSAFGSLASQFNGGLGDIVTGIASGSTQSIINGAIDLAGDAMHAVLDFGKSSIQLASDLQEVQNVVDVTFPTMSEKVNDFAKEMDKSAGLSETMAKQYTGTFGAMAKSFGFTEKEAYNLATALTQLTGDVASFYNLDQGEAYIKLKSIFSGETEPLKDLGIVMTQAALDAYALEKGLGKTTAEMSEQEKVALRYQYVMEGLSDASGDFVRTQDSWANQTRVLSLEWESFKTIIGDGLIEALSPGLEFLNNVGMPAIQFFGDVIMDVFNGAIAPINGFIEVLTLGGTAIVELCGAMGDLGTEIINWAFQVDTAQAQMDAAIQDNLNRVDQLLESYDQVREQTRDMLDDQISMFDSVSAESSKSASQIATDTEQTIATYERYGQELLSLVDRGIPRELAKQWADCSQSSIQMVHAFANASQADLDRIIAAFQRMSTVKDQLSAIFADIETGTSAQLQNIAAEWEQTFGSELPGLVKSAVDDALSYISGLQGQKIEIVVDVKTNDPTGVIGLLGENRVNNSYVPYEPEESASEWSYSPSAYSETFDPSMYAVDTDFIPYMASGEVVPPMASTYTPTGRSASFGDVSLANRDDLENMVVSLLEAIDVNTEETRQLRRTVEGVEIGDSTIGEAAVRYNRSMNVAGGPL